MRGRSLLREPPGFSVCAFCANRLGGARAPSHVQRRFLQNSKSTANYATPEARQPGSNASGGGGFGRPAFGRPSFGNATASSSNGPTFGRPAFGSDNLELTPEEKAARDALKRRSEEQAKREAEIKAENQRRNFKIHGGAGPEATRGGRPLPEVAKAGEALKWDERNARKEQAASAHSIGKVFVPSQNPRPQENSSITHSGAPAHVVGKVFIPLQNPQPQENKGMEGPRAFAQAIGKVFVPSEHPPQERQKTETAAPTRISFQRNTTNQAPGKFTISRPGSQPSAWSQKPAFGNTHMPKSNQVDEKSAEVESVAYKPIGIDKSERSIFRKKAEPAPELVQRNREEDMEIERAREERQRMRTTRFAEPKPEALARFELSDRGKKKKGKSTRRRGMEDDEEETVMSTKQREKLKAQRKAAKAAKKAAQPTPIFLPEYISVAHLATALRIKADDLVYKMEELGYEEMSMDHVMGAEDAGLIAQEYNFEPIVDRSESEDLKAAPPPEDPSILPPRPPVVTIMGHVDHGKTTILDYLRKSSVAATEHGGITQHIGAFSVTMPSGKIITFLDTPGHAAFLSMRQRGANVTDIVILVVAADDSVKPQTIEAINHAKAARVPIIVAINKVDKEEKNIDRVKQDLARHGVEIEDYGGDTQVVCVSGKTGQGMDELEDAAVTLSEILDMRADTEGQAEGWVLEASIKAMGKVATVLVRRGTLRPGDCIVAGNTWARIRVLRNEAGVEIASAGPGTPVQIDGWKEQPLAGDEVLQAPTEQKAKSVVDYRLEKEERERLAEDMEAINEDRRAVMDKRAADKEIAESEEPRKYVKEETDGGPKQIPFLIKGDVSGSVEAVVDSLAAIGNTEIQARILRSGVGAVSEFDIEHAAAANGYIVNFNTPIDPMMTRKAEALKVKILDHNIIYRLVDDVKAVLSEYLPPIVSTKVLGEAEVAQIFEITIKGRKQKPIAGCKVRNGVVGRNAKYRVMRNGKKVFDGTLESLKNVKKDVMEMRKGAECGIGFDGWAEFEVGDQIQAYETIEEKRYL